MGKLIATCALLFAAAQSAALRAPVPGGELVYEISGTGDPIVLLHGAFMDRRSWDAQVPALSSRFRVIRYDIRPFGESTVPEQAYSVPDDLLRLLDHLKIPKAHLVGHSFGGGVALDFALLHPERVATLTLVSAPPNGFAPPDEDRKLVEGIFAAAKQGDEALVRAWVAHPMWAEATRQPELAKTLEEMTRRNLRAFRLPFAPYVPVTPAAIGRLSSVKVPTFIIVGDRDMASIQRASAQMAQEIPGAKLHVVRGADHALPLGWAREFNEALVAFVSSARR
jgi:pimeloyl-ACP methyl ester carboxylesterase